MEPEAQDYVPSVFDAAVDARAPGEATRGQRLVNFLVDGVACLLLYYPVGYLVSAALYRFGAEIFDAVTRPVEAWPKALVLFAIISGAYYLVMETATRGRSLGKLITGTVAVREDGKPCTPHDAWMRSICRLMPLEPFSALTGRPWHDRFSKTRVVQQVKVFAPVTAELPDASANYDVVR